jgi:plastocyanin
MLRKTLLATTAALLVLVSPAALAQETRTVEADDNVFEPPEITVQVGDTVVFDNVGDLPHTATAEDGSFDSGNLDPGQNFEVTFDTPGTFPYICEYHEVLGMVGTVVVEGEGGPPAPSPAPPAEPTPEPSPQESPAPGADGDTAAAPPEVVGEEQRRLGPLAVAALGLLAAVGLAGSSLMRGG